MDICECVQDGITTKFRYDDAKWCCKTTEDQCIRDGYNIICNGTALRLSDQCHNEDDDGQSCNYYPLDEFRNGKTIFSEPRSYIDLCQDNRYVQRRVHKEVCYESLFSF